MFVPDAKVEELVSLAAQRFPRSGEKNIIRNKETVMVDRSWMFGDHIETDFSQFSL